jgi:hypothetical protein
MSALREMVPNCDSHHLTRDTGIARYFEYAFKGNPRPIWNVDAGFSIVV